MPASPSPLDVTALLAGADPARVAIVFQGRAVSDGWLEETSRRLASGIAGLLQPGQLLALWLHNSPELIALYLACLRCGVVPVPLRCEMRQAELNRILKLTNARVLVSSSRLMAGVDGAFHRQLERVFCVDGAESNPRLEPWSGLLADDSAQCGVHRNADSPAIILATSGSAGEPKAVVLSVANLEQILAGRVRVCGLDSHSVAVTGSCLTQSVGLHQVLGMLAAGGLVVLFEDYDIDRMARAVNEHRPSHLIMVVSAFNRLLDHPQINAGSLRNIRFASVGADRVTAAVQRKFMLLTGKPLSVTYGLTESSWALVNDSARPDKALSIGRPEPPVQVRLVDGNGLELGSDTVGEIQVRSPRTMLAYFNAPERTREVLVDGWLSTGDLAYRDGEGFYWFAGRQKNLIVLNTGDTVSPVEVEQVLSLHPAVLDCLVTSAEAEQDGAQYPIAYIVPAPGVLTAEALRRHLDKHLSAYKHPREMHFVSALPTGETGKLVRAWRPRQ